MKTFIFGAGASLHAGYPLASELWQAMEIWAQKTFPAGHDFTSAAATMNKEFDLSKSFELVLMDLDNRIEPLLRERPNTDEGLQEKVTLVYTRATIQRMIPIYFNSIRSGPATLYEVFAKEMLMGGDAIITFNYDVSLDRELKRSDKWSIGDGYGFSVPPFAKSPCGLFKLHGSTNWSGEPFGGSMGFGQMSGPPMGQRPIVQKAEFDYLGYENGSDPQCHDGRVRIESIIMPTANKKFFLDTSAGREWQGFWDSIWSQAAMVLKRSSEIYLIGYSIPEYDTRARELIRSQIRRGTPVRVCCHSGTSDVIQVIKSLGHVDVCATHPQTFEGWTGSGANLHG